jgi:hypothetical protein
MERALNVARANGHPSIQIMLLKCTGKPAAYIYHMYKDHWCGQDYDFENEKYLLQRRPTV